MHIYTEISITSSCICVCCSLLPSLPIICPSNKIYNVEINCLVVWELDQVPSSLKMEEVRKPDKCTWDFQVWIPEMGRIWYVEKRMARL